MEKILSKLAKRKLNIYFIDIGTADYHFKSDWRFDGWIKVLLLIIYLSILSIKTFVSNQFTWIGSTVWPKKIITLDTNNQANRFRWILLVLFFKNLISRQRKRILITI